MSGVKRVDRNGYIDNLYLPIAPPVLEIPVMEREKSK